MLEEVFDLRYPRVGARKFQVPRTFDALENQLPLRSRCRVKRIARALTPGEGLLQTELNPRRS